MPPIQKGSVAKQHGAIFQDWMNFPKQQRRSCSGNDALPEETLVSVRVRDSRMAKGIAGKGQMSVCKHICEHHAEVVDPWVWGNLPRELVELVFAKLPLPRIIELRKCSKGMPRMICNTSDFREACSESHPVLFGLLGWDAHHESLGTRLLDVKSKEWLLVELAGLPGAVSTTRCEPAHYCRWVDSMPDDGWNHVYMNSMSACDGGLGLLRPLKSFGILSFGLVCNPLTSVWETLPLTPLGDFENKELILVQLVMEGDGKGYTVILVSHGKSGEWWTRAKFAHVYNSGTGTWSAMDSGLVYGCGFELMVYQHNVPFVFDCTTETLFDLGRCFGQRFAVAGMDYSVAKDCLFVLHPSIEPSKRGGFNYLVSQCKRESRSSNVRELNVSETPVQAHIEHHRPMLFASPSFVLIFTYNGTPDEDHDRQIGLYDVAANRWDVPSAMSSSFCLPWLSCGGMSILDIPVICYL